MRAVSAIALASLLATAILPTSTADAATDPPGWCTALTSHTDGTSPPYKVQSCFDEPTGGGQSDVIRARLAALIAAASPGSTVRLALYNIEDYVGADPLFQALKTFRSNGGLNNGDVGVIVDQASDPSAITKMTNASIPVTVCRGIGTCLMTQGSSPLMHNKFLMIKDPTASKDTVAQFTFNDTTNGLEQTQDMMVVQGSAPLRQAYQDYWQSMYNNAWTGVVASTHSVPWTSTYPDSHVATFMPYPNTNPPPADGSDYVADLLKNVNCGAGGSENISVAASETYSNRPAEAKQLAVLAHSGCNVQVIMDNLSDVSPFLIDAAKSGFKLPCSQVRTYNGPFHDKFIKMNANVYGGAKSLVLSGSLNLNDSSLYNHDNATLLASGDDLLAGAFTTHYNFLVANSTVVPSTNQTLYPCR